MPDGIKKLFKEVRDLIHNSRRIAARGVNAIQVMANFEIGRLIVEHEQEGKERASYGKRILKELSRDLTSEFGRGFSKSNLEYMRRFYLENRARLDGKTQTPSGQLIDSEIKGQTLSDQSLSISQTLSAESLFKFDLSWSH